MDETIGVKGGKNDQKRRLFITKKLKEKLEKLQQEKNEEELKKLEKKVKEQQRITLIKILPIIIGGHLYQALLKNKEQIKHQKKEELIKLIRKENAFAPQEIEEIIAAIKNNQIKDLKEETREKLRIEIVGEEVIVLQEQEEKEINKKVSNETTKALEEFIQVDKKEQETTTVIGINDTQKEKLERLKAHKIVEEYEIKLKDVRKELRDLIFEYNQLVSESEEIYEEKKADELLEKLNLIIEKIEELKRILAIPDIEKYDSNYIYTLVEEYMESFKNKNFVYDIKDSDLYIAISSTIEEFEEKKDKLQNKVEERKEKVGYDQEKYEEMKAQSQSYERFNEQLIKFQKDQESIVEDLKKKIEKSVTTEEITRTRVVGMNRNLRRLMQLSALSMAIPGARSARTLATAVTLTAYYMRALINPHVETYTETIKHVKDYSKEIESNILELENITQKIQKSIKDLDMTILEFTEKYKEYLPYIPEFNDLLINLETIKKNLQEKEYEIEKTKQEEEENLAKNNAKVLIYAK